MARKPAMKLDKVWSIFLNKIVFLNFFRRIQIIKNIAPITYNVLAEANMLDSFELTSGLLEKKFDITENCVDNANNRKMNSMIISSTLSRTTVPTNFEKEMFSYLLINPHLEISPILGSARFAK